MRSNITILLLISTTSVVFTLPDPLYLLLMTYITDTESEAFHRLITFSYILPSFDSVNRSVNITLFCIFSSKFRLNLKGLLLCSRNNRDGGIGREITPEWLASRYMYHTKSLTRAHTHAICRFSLNMHTSRATCDTQLYANSIVGFIIRSLPKPCTVCQPDAYRAHRNCVALKYENTWHYRLNFSLQ